MAASKPTNGLLVDLYILIANVNTPGRIMLNRFYNDSEWKIDT